MQQIDSIRVEGLSFWNPDFSLFPIGMKNLRVGCILIFTPFCTLAIIRILNIVICLVIVSWLLFLNIDIRISAFPSRPSGLFFFLGLHLAGRTDGILAFLGIVIAKLAALASCLELTRFDQVVVNSFV